MRTSELVIKRNKALKRAHIHILKAGRGVNFISRKTIIELIKEQPAPRFYILPETAKLYILGLRETNEKNKDMIADLKENYKRLKAENPGAKKEWLYETVVEQPAKSFYMTDKRIEEVVFGFRTRKKKAAAKAEQANQ